MRLTVFRDNPFRKKKRSIKHNKVRRFKTYQLKSNQSLFACSSCQLCLFVVVLVVVVFSLSISFTPSHSFVLLSFVSLDTASRTHTIFSVWKHSTSGSVTLYKRAKHARSHHTWAFFNGNEDENGRRRRLHRRGLKLGQIQKLYVYKLMSI